MSILDDARAGMDPDIRPQDDLFGHVNGRWLDETEIPADRSTWGAFVTLADTAEQQVREIIEQLAAGSAEGNAAEVASADNAEDARKVGDLYASFMDTERIDALGARPLRPLIDAVEGLRDVRDLAAFLGEFERVGGYGLFGSYVNTDDRDSDRYLFHVTQGGLGLPDESYYREEKFAEIREAYVAYLTRLLGLGGHESPEAAAATVLEIDTRLAAGHWERAETRDVQKTYNLLTAEQLRELCPAFDWDAYVTNLGAADLDPERVLAEVCVRQPSYLAHLSTVLDEVPLDDWRAWLLAHVLRSAASYLTDDFVETNFDFYGRTLNGTPELRARWKRGVGFVEGALGEAVGPRVRRPALPADLQGADGRPGRQPAGRLPRVDLRARLDERGDQAAGLREARDLPPEDRLPRHVPRLLRAAGHPRRPARQRRRGLRLRDRPAPAQDRLPGRPRRVVHAAADRQRLLQPRHQRDLLPGRHPAAAVLLRRRRRRPRTTAASEP